MTTTAAVNQEPTPASVWQEVGGTINNERLAWPPDVFALIDTPLARGEAYRLALSPPRGRSGCYLAMRKPAPEWLRGDSHVAYCRRSRRPIPRPMSIDMDRAHAFVAKHHSHESFGNDKSATRSKLAAAGSG